MDQDVRAFLEQDLARQRALLARLASGHQQMIADTRARLEGVRTIQRPDIEAHLTAFISQLEVSYERERALMEQGIADTDATLAELDRREAARS